MADSLSTHLDRVGGEVGSDTRFSFGPLRFRAVEDMNGGSQLRAMAFDDRGQWRGRVIVQTTPAGRVMRVFVTPEVEVIQESNDD